MRKAYAFMCYKATYLKLISLTRWWRVTHICARRPTIIGSDNGLAPTRRQAIIWTNAGIMLIGSFGTKSSEILIEIRTFSFRKMNFKMSSANWRWHPQLFYVLMAVYCCLQQHFFIEWKYLHHQGLWSDIVLRSLHTADSAFIYIIFYSKYAKVMLRFVIAYIFM